MAMVNTLAPMTRSQTEDTSIPASNDGVGDAVTCDPFLTLVTDMDTTMAVSQASALGLHSI